MKIDIVIANPPYNRWKLHTKIANKIKLKNYKVRFYYANKCGYKI